MRGRFALASSFLTLVLPAAASADITLTASMTVDNSFTASISTSPTAAGTTFLTGNNWPTVSTGSFVFPAAGTYYLQVEAVDGGPPAMFIGQFGLAGGNATFSNGTAALVSNTTNWVVSNSGFGVGTVTPLDIGPNGTGPWGNFGAISSDAHYLWAPTYTPVVYFTTVITVVPAPAGAAVLGLGALAALRRRRR
jgi:hypothetical protein